MKNFLHCEFCGAKNHKNDLACHCCGAPVGIMEEEDTRIVINPISIPESRPLDTSIDIDWLYRPYITHGWEDYHVYYGTRTICSGNSNIGTSGAHSHSVPTYNSHTHDFSSMFATS